MNKNMEHPEDMLNEEVKPMEILEYLDEKYDSYNIVSQKTIKRWLDELGIDCIQPRPARNKDIRYKKSDVLKLEEKKRYNLLEKSNKKIRDNEMRKIANEEKLNRQSYNDYLSSMTEEERILSDNADSVVNDIIKNDMLEMCFKKLFPNTTFDKEELAKNLHVAQPDISASDEEKGEAIIYIRNKSYIKTKKQ